jgi:ribosome-binding protein aMBF1 (putative translation factor)
MRRGESVLPRSKRDISPIGTSVEADIQRRLRDDPEFRAEWERIRPFQQLARIVIMRRAKLGISQAELALRMGTTASVVSRIESGQHRTNVRTLERLAQALGGRAVIGIEFDSDSKTPTLIALSAPATD